VQCDLLVLHIKEYTYLLTYQTHLTNEKAESNYGRVAGIDPV